MQYFGKLLTYLISKAPSSTTAKKKEDFAPKLDCSFNQRKINRKFFPGLSSLFSSHVHSQPNPSKIRIREKLDPGSPSLKNKFNLVKNSRRVGQQRLISKGLTLLSDYIPPKNSCLRFRISQSILNFITDILLNMKRIVCDT